MDATSVMGVEAIFGARVASTITHEDLKASLPDSEKGYKREFFLSPTLTDTTTRGTYRYMMYTFGMCSFFLFTTSFIHFLGTWYIFKYKYI